MISWKWTTATVAMSESSARMSQVEREKITSSSFCVDSGATSASTAASRTRTMRESIEIERGERRQAQLLDRATESVATSTGSCVAAAAARDSSSPPLTLIDANVARQASASLSDKSQRQTPPQLPPTTTTTAKTTTSAGKLAIESTTSVADKFASLDKDKFFRQQQDELNNNSIHVAQSYCPSTQHQSQQQQQQQQVHQFPSQRQQTQQAQSSLSQSIKQTQSQLISPLNLLTGLRMHTNNLRSQQQQSGAKISNTNTSSPVSFVESSLNPCNEDEESNNDRRANTRAQTSRPLQGINVIPSYTSIFDKPRASQLTAAPSSTPSGNQSHQQQPASTYQRSTLTSARDSTQATRTTSRSPLRKQGAHFDSLSSSRTLLTTISSIGNKSHKQEKNELKELPSVFDYSSGQLRRPIDYDNQSRSQADFDLEAGSSVGQSQTDEDDDDDQDDDEDDCDGVATIVDEKSPFNGRKNSKSNAATSSRSRTTFASVADDRRRVQESVHASKFAGSATRLNQFMRPKETSSGSSRKIMSSSGKKSLASQQPLAQQTRISMGDISRPPSFDTASSQLQKHDQSRAASCRKLDFLEQVAHLDCHCQLCLQNRKLSNLHDHLYHHQSTNGINAKLSKFDANSAKSLDLKYPKTRVCHMVLKSIILVLCTLLLLLLLVSAILLSHYLPQSLDKVMNASRSFNVTIAGRR